MNTYVNKTQENKGQSIADAVSQKKSKTQSTFQFVDNRPEAIAQRKLQEMANKSPQAKQAAQLQSISQKNSLQEQTIQKEANNTGLPDNLKAGIEKLSGFSMDNVKVHYNSDKPAQLQAHAYAQGTNIHIAPGQEKHLPHEAWHVAQQKQGRVRPTLQMKDNVNINDDTGLEKEADVMGAKAVQMKLNEKENNSLYNFVTQKKSRVKHGFGFVDNRTDAMREIQLQKTINNSIIQRKYYNATDNEITERPEETSVIANAKQKEKDAIASKGYPIDKFTAHHKYPWNKIKDDIKEAFYAPKTDKSLKALNNLENFSGNKIPITREKFLNSEDHRKNTYQKDSLFIDKWIQEVCWVPGNIFIGPLSDKRIDDPSKRGGTDDFDAHHYRPRRMSIRSEQLREVFTKGGLTSKSVSILNNSVAGYDPDEWQEHEKLLASKLYSQKYDPYFEESIFQFNVTAAPINIQNHAADNYSFEITVLGNITISNVGYTKVNIGRVPDSSEMVNPVLSKTEDGVNYYKVTVLTPGKYILKDFQAELIKDSKQQKTVKLECVCIKRP